MPDFNRGVRPIVYPGASYRTSREVAAMNDEHSPERLPVHEEFVVQHPSGDGWDELITEVIKYNAVTDEEAAAYVGRMLVDPALSDQSSRAYGTTVLGVKCRLVKTE